jgi:nitrate reductase gamma subunit
MDRVHSSLIIILLSGILLMLGGNLFVLLVGRDMAISVGRDKAIPVLGGAFGVALVVGTLALFIRYLRRKRREGQPWLFHFILWPAYIGVLAILGLAARILSTMPVAALKSASGKFRFIGSRSRSCSWAR